MAFPDWRCLLALAVLLPASAGAAEPCDRTIERVQAAIGSGDFARFEALHAELRGCEARMRSHWSDEMARALYRDALNRIRQKNETLSTQRASIERALAFGDPYEVLAMQCRIEQIDKRYAQAQGACERALVRLQDLEKTPNPPRPEAVERIFKMAEENRLLAANYVASPTTRSGEMGGIASAEVRGFVVKKVSVPIRFQFGNAELTPDGERAAADLVNLLKEQRPKRIRLVGHTDPLGTDTFNDTLSLERAKAVERFLARRAAICDPKGKAQAGCLALTVDVDGRGKREPYKPTNPDELTQEQLHQLSRRVELVRE